MTMQRGLAKRGVFCTSPVAQLQHSDGGADGSTVVLRVHCRR